HGRSAERLAATEHDVRGSSGSDRVHRYQADLSSLDAVRGLAREIERDQPRLDVLVNNAALGSGLPGSPREVSTDGYELRVTVNAVHPASLMNTKMVYEAFGYTLSTIADGVAAVLPLVIAPELEGVTGRYFDRLEDARAQPQAYDLEARRRLWRLSEELVGDN